MSEILNNKLGRRLTVQEVAEALGLDPRTINKYYSQLGGIRVGKMCLFFENLILEKLKGGCHALQEKGQVDCLREAEGGVEQISEAIPDVSDWEKTGSPSLGTRTKKNSFKRPTKWPTTFSTHYTTIYKRGVVGFFIERGKKQWVRITHPHFNSTPQTFIWTLLIGIMRRLALIFVS